MAFVPGVAPSERAREAAAAAAQAARAQAEAARLAAERAEREARQAEEAAAAKKKKEKEKEEANSTPFKRFLQAFRSPEVYFVLGVYLLFSRVLSHDSPLKLLLSDVCFAHCEGKEPDPAMAGERQLPGLRKRAKGKQKTKSRHQMKQLHHLQQQKRQEDGTDGPQLTVYAISLMKHPKRASFAMYAKLSSMLFDFSVVVLLHVLMGVTECLFDFQVRSDGYLSPLFLLALVHLYHGVDYSWFLMRMSGACSGLSRVMGISGVFVAAVSFGVLHYLDDGPWIDVSLAPHFDRFRKEFVMLPSVQQALAPGVTMDELTIPVWILYAMICMAAASFGAALYFPSRQYTSAVRSLADGHGYFLRDSTPQWKRVLLRGRAMLDTVLPMCLLVLWIKPALSDHLGTSDAEFASARYAVAWLTVISRLSLVPHMLQNFLTEPLRSGIWRHHNDAVEATTTSSMFIATSLCLEPVLLGLLLVLQHSARGFDLGMCGSGTPATLHESLWASCISALVFLELVCWNVLLIWQRVYASHFDAA